MTNRTRIYLDLWLDCVELMGIFLVCIGFFTGSFLFEESLVEVWLVDSAPEDLDLVDGNDGGLAADDVFEDSLSLAAVSGEMTFLLGP